MHHNFFRSRCVLLLLILFSFSDNSLAQLAGTYTIPGTPFATLKKAADSLNIVGVGTGGVTFNVASGYTENITSPITITASGTTTNPITIQKEWCRFKSISYTNRRR